MAQPIYLTPEGYAKTQAELEHFRTIRRQEVADRIQRANAIGSTVDNAEYDEAKNEQAFIEGHILTLENIINNAEIIDVGAKPSDIVTVGSKVSVLDQSNKKREKYFIVGSPEADPSQGKISNVSPIGQALLGKRVGEVAQVKVPAGIINLEILKVK